MAPQIVLRRHPLLTDQSSSAGGLRFGEVAGGTAAECAAVCCCCPCGLVNLLVLVAYKIPAGLFRRVCRRRKRRVGKLQLPPSPPPPWLCGCHESELHIHPITAAALGVCCEKIVKMEESEKEAIEALEKEMWEGFYSAGFWRSSSQREDFVN